MLHGHSESYRSRGSFNETHVIREKLTAWEGFVHAQDDLDPLVRMAR